MAGGPDGSAPPVDIFGHRIQPLQQWVTKMWLCLGPSCPDRTFFEELSNAEINTRIFMVLDHGENLNPKASPTPLIEGVVITRVGLFGSIMAACVNSFSHHSCDLVQGLGVPATSHGVSACSRTRRSGRRTAPTMMLCGCRKRRRESGVFPIGRRNSGGKTPSLNLIPQRRRRGR
jgi:hypothetical protein